MPLIDQERLDEDTRWRACLGGTPVHEWWLIRLHGGHGQSRTPEMEQHMIEVENISHGRRFMECR